MAAPGWLTQHVADVPDGNAWLGLGERRVLAGLRFERRRTDWRLGRWTAKSAVSRCLGTGLDSIEIIAATDGAPEVWVDGHPAPLSVSLSHRGGCGLAAVSSDRGGIGCDLELIEARSEAFVRQWLARSERRLLHGCAARERALMANLLWAAKEAAAKVRREGLRLDVRRAVVNLEPGRAFEAWRPLRVDWGEPGLSTPGWWRVRSDWVMVIAGAAAPEVPCALVPSALMPTAALPSGHGIACIGAGASAMLATCLGSAQGGAAGV